MINWNYLMRVAFCNNISVLELTEQLCNDAVKNGIEGDFAECGVGYGAHGVIMNECSKGHKVYLFDSFEGIPEHSDLDIEFTQSHGSMSGDQRKSSGITVCSVDAVVETMRRVSGMENVVLVKGWFIDTFPTLTGEKFSVLRLDCDIYESYMLCFKHMLPRLSKGGWLIIDDWVLTGCKKAIIDYGMKLDFFTVENNIAYLKWDTHLLQNS